LLSLSDVSNNFHDSILVHIKAKMYQTVKISQIQPWNAFETSNKLNKIWIKRLNLRVSKDELLNWFKDSKR